MTTIHAEYVAMKAAARALPKRSSVHRVQFKAANGKTEIHELPHAATIFPRGLMPSVKKPASMFFSGASSSNGATTAEALRAETERERRRADEAEAKIASLRGLMAGQYRARTASANTRKALHERELHALRATALRSLPAHEAREHLLRENPIRPEEIVKFAREARCSVAQAFERLQAERAFAAGLVPESFADVGMPVRPLAPSIKPIGR